MVRQIFAAVLLAAMPVGLVAAAQEASAPERLALEGVAAIVNDQPISYSDVRQRARLLLLSLGGQQPSQEQIQQITGQALEQLIDERLQLEKAAEFEMEIAPEEINGAVDDMARQSGATGDQLKQQLLAAGVNPTSLEEQMRAEIARIQKKLFATTIYVTHDQIEAMTMGDRVAVLRDGVLQQIGKPKELYDNPTNIFVAGFIGSPSMNLFSGYLSDGVLQFGRNSISLPKSLTESKRGLAAFDNREIIFGVRPEDISETTSCLDATRTKIRAYVSVVEELGSEHVVHLDVGGHYVDNGNQDVKDEIATSVKTIARFESNSTVALGDQIEVAIEPEKLHFFDPCTSLAI